MSDHRRYQALLAALVLDPTSLEPDEERDLKTHLGSCPECRKEEAELRSVVAALDSASPDESFEEPPPYLEDEVVTAIIADHPEAAAHEEHGHRSGGWNFRNLWRRPQFGIPAIAFVAAAVFVMVAVVFPFLSRSQGPPGLGETETVAFTGAPQNVTTDAAVIAHTWGTELDLTVEGLKPGEVYSVDIESRDGNSVEAGTFVGVREGVVDCEMNGAVLRQDARAVLVTNASGDTVMRADLEPAPAPASVT